MIDEKITYLASEVFERLVEQELRGQCSPQEIAYLKSHPAILEQWKQVLLKMQSEVEQSIRNVREELGDLQDVVASIGTSTHTIIVNRRTRLTASLKNRLRLLSHIKLRIMQIKPMMKQANIALTQQRQQAKRERARDAQDALSQAVYFSWRLLSQEPPQVAAAHQLLDLTLAALHDGDEFPYDLFDFYRDRLKPASPASTTSER